MEDFERARADGQFQDPDALEGLVEVLMLEPLRDPE
jgi:hypothetical protein